MFTINKKKGFTLIELLVVVAIILLLASVVLASLSSAKIKARDTRRKADLHSLEVAIELYYTSNNGTFPNDDDTRAGDWSSAFKTQLAPYTPSPSIDPLENNVGRYYAAQRMTWAPDPNCNGQYVIWAYMESGPNTGSTCGFVSSEYFRVLGKY